jgi:formylglycine-generating enzyme required for sulfatase activity
LRLTRKSVLLFWMVGIILSMCTACTETTLKPEAALWGHWAVVAGQGGEPPLANNLIFYEDGRLVMDGEHSQPALYVVIAPGRMKLTRGDEILVLNYSVDEGMLQLNTEGKNQRFTYLGEPEIAVLSTAVSQVSPTAPEPLTLQPPTFTPTILLITSTPDLPTSTPVLPTATEAIPTQTPTDSLEDFYVDVKVIPKDGMVMVFVPEGEFIMGTNPNEDPFFWGAEGPAHEVYVDAFWIYQTEVTNAMYQACVAEKACPKPLRNDSRTVADYYTAEEYANYPVIQVNWVLAVAYCQWAGGRLPTEAEWEKAARGTDGRLFPWGNTPLAPDLASFCGSSCPGSDKESIDDGYPEIAPVGIFPGGASPYGALDMAGNVWEWVFDYFDQNYYSRSEYDNPRGPASGSRRVIRGGSWFNPADGLRTLSRASLPPQVGLDTVGFRCVHEIKD